MQEKHKLMYLEIGVSGKVLAVDFFGSPHFDLKI